MRRIIALAALPLALAAVLYLAGCNGDAAKTNGGNSAETDHDHDHDHAHAHGPHGGALVELGNDEKYHAEWTTDEDGKVTVWILDGSGEKEVPIAAEKLTIDTSDPKGEASFDLESEDVIWREAYCGAQLPHLLVSDEARWFGSAWHVDHPPWRTG